MLDVLRGASLVVGEAGLEEDEVVVVAALTDRAAWPSLSSHGKQGRQGGKRRRSSNSR